MLYRDKSRLILPETTQAAYNFQWSRAARRKTSVPGRPYINTNLWEGLKQQEPYLHISEEDQHSAVLYITNQPSNRLVKNMRDLRVLAAYIRVAKIAKKV